jgi:hypothetical protein
MAVATELVISYALECMHIYGCICMTVCACGCLDQRSLFVLVLCSLFFVLTIVLIQKYVITSLCCCYIKCNCIIAKAAAHNTRLLISTATGENDQLEVCFCTLLVDTTSSSRVRLPVSRSHYLFSDLVSVQPSSSSSRWKSMVDASSSTVAQSEDLEHTSGNDLLEDDEGLSTSEIWWMEQYDFLESRGYRLRPRYRPGWIPSWHTNGKPNYLCEDSAFSLVGRSHLHHVMSLTNYRLHTCLMLSGLRIINPL